MTLHHICIEWYCGTEVIDIGDLNPTARQIKTTEFRDAGVELVYIVNVSDFRETKGKGGVTLHYVEKKQTDGRVKDPKNLVRWGKSRIRWNASTHRASAYWIDDVKAGTQWDGRPRRIWIFGGDKPANMLRRTASVVVKQRPEQQALRRYLMAVGDRACVLTSEKDPTALEAAHIVPVKADGQETAANAILLRADLHRLFDAGLFWFEVRESEAVVRCEGGISETYQNLLSGKRLQGEKFARVKLQLLERLTRPDSRGLGSVGDS